MKRCVIITAALGLIGAESALAQEDPEIAEAGRQYQARCLSCHQPPDLSLATDRAWLDQVNRTA